MTSLVQQWKSGTRTNYGFLLAQAGTTFGTLDYDSSENASLRIPRLTVIYATQGSPAILPVQADTWINQACRPTTTAVILNSTWAVRPAVRAMHC